MSRVCWKQKFKNREDLKNTSLFKKETSPVFIGWENSEYVYVFKFKKNVLKAML